MVVAVVLGAPLAAMAADGDGEGPMAVAQITRDGETIPYDTLDAAIGAAQDGETIELLANATTGGIILRDKSITISGSEDLDRPSVEFTDRGIALYEGHGVRFENCAVQMNGVTQPPADSDWGTSDYTIITQGGCGVELVNSEMYMDASGPESNEKAGGQGMYFAGGAGSKLLLDGSKLVIRDYASNAISHDGVNGTIEVINRSVFTSDNNRSGVNATFDITVSGSTFEVINSTGNASNGSNFLVKDGSEVTFSNNGEHGLSAGSLTIQASTVTASGNGYNGIHTSGSLSVTEGSTVTIESNGCARFSEWSKPGALYVGSGDSVIRDSTVTIWNNTGSGIYQNSADGSLTIEDSATVTVTGNVAEKLGLGGGIYANGRVSLGSGVELYNNHAGTAGDDIYVTESGSITFGETKEGWKLDGEGAGDETHCADPIDGWYDDSESSRWEAHTTPYHADEFTDFERNGVASTNGPLALKAAHGVTPLEPGDPNPDWTHSKSKHATNLDENYESEVTLSLPSAQEQLVTDVVFVIDKSTSTDVRKDAIDMLDGLRARVAETEGAAVKVGVIVFNKDAHQYGWFDLSDEAGYQSIVSAINNDDEIAGGTNVHAGLVAGKAMLDEDSGVAASRKYLILVSDGITYLYNDEGGTTSSTLNIGYVAGESTKYVVQSDSWDSKYEYGASIRDITGISDTEDAVDAFLDEVGERVAADDGAYDIPYDTLDQYFGENGLGFEAFLGAYPNSKALKGNNRTSPIGNDEYAAAFGDEQDNHANNIEKALYLSAETYRAAEDACYHCFAVKKSESGPSESFPYGDEFMDYLAGGEEVSFDDIENDIYYLLDAGSEVVDTIGYGTGTIKVEGEPLEYEYNFDFVDDVERLSLTVNGEPQGAEKIEDPNFSDAYVTSAYGFGKNEDGTDGPAYDFELYYYANGRDGDSDECFVWKINVPVSNFAPVQLTYAVRLTDPQDYTGTYGEYDADGERELPGLLTNKEAVLYPVDSNEEPGVPEHFYKPTVEYGVASIQPADITIYMGGSDGYDGVVDGSGDTELGEANNSLPEPGFYITLPDEINQALAKAGYSNGGAPANLSELLEIYVPSADGGNSREWSLVPYGATDGNSHAFDKYIYRIVSPEGQDPVRLQFKDAVGNVYTSDTFTPSSALFSEYEMSIYPGQVDQNMVRISVTIPGAEGEDDTVYTCTVKVVPGDLTVRYVTGNQADVVTGIVSEGEVDDVRAQNPGKAYATVPEGTTFTINGSNVDVAPDPGDGSIDATPSLLFDDIVTSSDAGNQDQGHIDAAAEALIAGAEAIVESSNGQLEDPQFEAKYIDLVDATNGNVWLSASNDVTVYWPLPEEATSSTRFYLVHFDGIDREMNNDQIAKAIEAAIENGEAAEVDNVENIGDGVKFTTTSFSPFVLVWGASSTTPPKPGGDDKGDLTIKKEITGDLKSADDVFTFQVTVKGAGDQEFGEVQFTDDVATIQLKGGESITISDLPEGADYAIVETDAGGYELVSATNDDGKITDDEVTATFTNDKSTPDEPEDPDEPDNPDDPDEPDNPDEPDEPDNPGTPDTPDDPGDPGTPSEPSKPGRPSTPTSQVPDAGDHTSAVLPVALVVCGVALVGGGLVIAKRRAS